VPVHPSGPSSKNGRSSWSTQLLVPA
jgi:hypothetical protein